MGHSDPFLVFGVMKIKEETTMISKEKKTAVINEYARSEGDTGDRKSVV